MRGQPWWIEAVNQLPSSAELAGVPLADLWSLAEEIRFIRENIEPALLDVDLGLLPGARPLWRTFEGLEPKVSAALEAAAHQQSEQLRKGGIGPQRFRAMWSDLGFLPRPRGGGTPADDFLDATFRIARLTLGEAKPECGLPNMSSRAARIADFLDVLAPTPNDVVVDVGSGSGKVALTTAASTSARVIGVEYGAGYVAAARATANRAGLRNVTFECADARDFDLSLANLFYLYYPFHGPVAEAFVAKLALLARVRPIRVYAAGPRNGFGEYLERAVGAGALALQERRGEFSEVMVLRSAKARG